MAIETGSGSKAERSPASTSKSSSSSSSSKTSNTSKASSSSTKNSASSSSSKTTNTAKSSATKNTAKSISGSSSGSSSGSKSSSSSSSPRSSSSSTGSSSGNKSSSSSSSSNNIARERAEKKLSRDLTLHGSMQNANAMAERQSGLAAALAQSIADKAATSKASPRVDVKGEMPSFSDLASAFTTKTSPKPAEQSGDMRLMRQPMSAPLGVMPTMEELARVMPATKQNSIGSMPTLSSIEALRSAAPGEHSYAAGLPFRSGRMLAASGALDGGDPYTTLMEDAEALTPAYPRPSRERPVDPRIVQTMLGEAAGQGPTGIAAVGQTIMNRSQANPNAIVDPLDVVLSPLQYSTWNSPANGGNNPTRYQPGTPEFKAAEEIWRDVRDNAYDFTGGATHFVNPRVASPTWADPNIPGTENKHGVLGIADHNYFPTLSAAERANISRNPSLDSSVAAGGGPPSNGAPVPFTRPSSAGIGIAAGAGYADGLNGLPVSISDRVRLAQSPTNSQDRLMPNVGEAGGIGIAPSQIQARAIDHNGNYIGAGPPMGIAASAVGSGTMGGPTGPIPASYVEEAAIPAGRTNLADILGGNVPMPRKDPRKEETAWDKTVSFAGDALDNTLIGGAIKAIFPEFWEGAGDAIKGIGGNGLTLDSEQRYSLNPGTLGGDSGGGGGSGGGGSSGSGTDLAGTPVLPNYDLLKGIWFPEVRWPGQGYNPGVDNEWDYFPAFADGGPVLAPQRMADTPPTSGLDPRIITIMNAEDALRGQHPQPDEAIKAFVDAFGEEALRKLHDRVLGAPGQSEDGPRMIAGPGGPKDDLVPAVIDGTQPAKLSSGEFVMPAEAVAGAGEGDPVAGAEKLTQLASMLGQSA